MVLDVKEFHKPHMPWRILQSIIPILINEDISVKEKRNLESWVTLSLIPSKKGTSPKTPKGRGGMRKFSVASAIAIMTLWELVRFGFKPYMCGKAIKQMIALGERAVEEDNASFSNIDSIFLYYDRPHMRPGDQSSLCASREDIARWILNPKEDGDLSSKINERPESWDGLYGDTDYHAYIPVYMVLDAEGILRRIIGRYLYLKSRDFSLKLPEKEGEQEDEFLSI